MHVPQENAPLFTPTPFIASTSLSKTTGREVWLKLEAVQPAGSFKIRGIGHAVEKAARNGVKAVTIASSGSAGLAAAYAARHYGLKAIIVVPTPATDRAKSLINQEGADVIVHGANWNEANDYALSLRDSETAYLHPFDDKDLWQGYATIIDEMAQKGPKPDLIVLSVGGGGLLSGILDGLDNNGWSETAVLAVETEGAASLSAALKAKKVVDLESVNTIATALGTRRVCDGVVERALKHNVTCAQVSDRQALDACRRFADDHRLIVEPACGAALAALYSNSPQLGDYQRIGVVVCGGSSATYAQYALWQEQLDGPGG